MDPASNVEHKSSMLLTKDENYQIFQLLGPRCQAMATTVVQLYATDGPDGVHWIKRDVGILCLVRDINKRSYFFRLFCLMQNRMIWEHEIYSSMQYLAPRSFLHTFEAEDGIVAFNFANESEAALLREILLNKLKTKEQKRLTRQKNKNAMVNSQNSTMRPTPRPAPPPTLNSMSNGYPPSLAPSAKSNSNKKFKKKSITKADIGIPLNFQHISHVGWDPNTGFEIGNVDESIRQFFDKAGISENDLKDKKTREFIYDFIEKHGGLDAVKDDIHQPTVPPPPSPPPPPPVPARNVPPVPQSSLRTAPPPPPSGTQRAQHPAPPPPPTVPPPSNVARTQDHIKKPNVTAPVTSSTQTTVRAPPPSPPAPPPLMPADVTTPAPSFPTSNGNAANTGSDSRSALMEAIRGGTTLKHVDPEKQKFSSDNSRGDLLNDIRRGVELKTVQPVTKQSYNPLPADGLAGALQRALAERNKAIHSDSSDTSETSDTDDEWDD